MSRCTLAITGAPLARRSADLVQALRAARFEVDYVLTPSASAWIAGDDLSAATGAYPRGHSQAGQSKRAPLPDLVVVCPATFNTISKIAVGVSDTPAHSFLNECIGASLPMFYVPMINDRLWNHFALADHFEQLTKAGGIFVDVRTGSHIPSAVPSGTGETVIDAFDPSWITERLPKP